MSRSGYSDDVDQWDLVRWRGAVARAIRGRRGQAFLKEMIAALDALPDRKLIPHELEAADGAVCALGAVGKARGIDMKPIDPECRELVARAFGISDALASEIMFMNDGERWRDTPEARFERVRAWAEGHIRPHKPDKRWEKKTAEPWTLDSFISWLEQQPADGVYDYYDCEGACLVGQYAASIGIHWFEDNVPCHPAFDFLNRIACGLGLADDRTYGGALERARRIRQHSSAERTDG